MFRPDKEKRYLKENKRQNMNMMGIMSMTYVEENVALFRIYDYKDGMLKNFKKWIHESFAEKERYSLIIDLTKLCDNKLLSYDDLYSLTYNMSEDINLARHATALVMDNKRLDFILIKELLFRSQTDNHHVAYQYSIHEALKWIDSIS